MNAGKGDINMMERILRGAVLGIFLGVVGGLAIGGLTYSRIDRNPDNTAVLALNEGALNEATAKNLFHDDTDGESQGTEISGDDASADAVAASALASLKEGILRFHIRANSDSVQDQILKLDLKDYALEMINPIMEEASSLEKAQELILAKMPYIKTQLEAYTQKAGYSYNVEIYFNEEFFPLKQYGDITFPAGQYTALRIDIGEKEGENWWCVMYPSLCFLDATHAVLSEEGKETLQNLLTKEEYEALMECNGEGNQATKDSKNVVYYHSKIFDTVSGWFQ